MYDPHEPSVTVFHAALVSPDVTNLPLWKQAHEKRKKKKKEKKTLNPQCPLEPSIFPFCPRPMYYFSRSLIVPEYPSLAEGRYNEGIPILRCGCEKKYEILYPGRGSFVRRNEHLHLQSNSATMEREHVYAHLPHDHETSEKARKNAAMRKGVTWPIEKPSESW
ncbi:hypothetical protein LZ32DRAFT_314064 [Colletotrichum eremochloae]|nr:hypothetical protein LZ32DRAFT_314064 [Colletotrichum eremochloae]